MLEWFKGLFRAKKVSKPRKRPKRLSEREKEAILNYLDNETYQQKTLANMYGVSQSTISKLKKEKKWD
jgi:DNA-directed RNA polymerase specialized sigma subunit